MTDGFAALTFPLQLAGTVVIELEFGSLGDCWNLTQENFTIPMGRYTRRPYPVTGSAVALNKRIFQ